jgi:adenosylhomocysteinase
VIGREQFLAMKDGAVICQRRPLRRRARPGRAPRAGAREPPPDPAPLDERTLRPDGRRIYLLAEGRLVNLGAAEGHPADVMDLSFADQALSAEHLVAHGRTLAAGVHPVPPALDREVARLKLAALAVEIDTPSEAQRAYGSAWQVGT